MPSFVILECASSQIVAKVLHMVHYVYRQYGVSSPGKAIHHKCQCCIDMVSSSKVAHWHLDGFGTSDLMNSKFGLFLHQCMSSVMIHFIEQCCPLVSAQIWYVQYRKPHSHTTSASFCRLFRIRILVVGSGLPVSQLLYTLFDIDFN